ncbi:MAG: transposase [Methylocella sp.]
MRARLSFVIAPSRGKSVVKGFPGAFRPDFWVSDRYGGQMGRAKKDNQVCLAHLIRDGQYAIDAGDGIFAPGLHHLLGRACRIGRRRDKLADVTRKIHAARLEARLDELMRRAPTHKAGVKLQRVIKKIRRHMFVFVANRAIPATINGSERALRPCVAFRKTTPTAFAPSGAPAFTPTSDPSSKPPPPRHRRTRSHPPQPGRKASRHRAVAGRRAITF